MKKIMILVAMLTCLFTVHTMSWAQPKGTLRVAVSTDLLGLDPLQAFTVSGLVMQRHIYDSLVSFGANGTIQPQLAVSWKLLDEKTWRFNLRKGIKFHNGYPFTAADVKFSIEYLLDPKNKWNFRTYFDSFDAIETIDDYTINIKTKIPDPVLPNNLAAFVNVISKKFYDENGSEGLKNQAIGTGPFKFVSWRRNDRLVLEANNEWYASPPKVKTLMFRIIPEMGARVAELQAGGVHIIFDVPPFMVSQLKKGEDTDVLSVPSLRTIYMIIDTLKIPQLKDRRVRQALNFGVDKEAIVKGILNGMGTPLGTHVPLLVGGADPSIKPYPYDPQKAKDLLKEAGYPNGFSLNLYSPNGRYLMDKEVTLAVADQLSKVGIKTNVQVMESNTYLKELSAHNLEGIYLIGIACRTYDVNYSLNQLNPNFVLCYYQDKELEEMVNKTKATMDSTKRYNSAYKIQKIVHDEAIFLPLYNEMGIYGVSKKVKGFEAPVDEMMQLWNVSVTE